MPTVPAISPTTGQPTPPYFIHTTDAQFVDNAGRSLILRGVNLSGSSKAPDGRHSQDLEGFWESGEVGGDGFGARPLNLDDGSADVHLARLKGWGFNMLRYVVTWEALEHAGPIYDTDYMDYTVRVLRRCKEYGFKVYMDPHQDVWSRFSGGSGAPYWTIPACGIEPRNFTATQATIVHCEYPNPDRANPAIFPAMMWSTNYGRLAAQTLFTLFFAGRDFAPKCIIDGVNIQDYLQSHYIAAFGELADRIRDAGDLLDECVIGWDSLNEPFEGFCGYLDLNKYPVEQTSILKKGTVPTPAQSFRLGMGRAQTVDNWTFGTFGPRKLGTVTVDPHGRTMWADPGTEPGGVHPVWGWTRDPAWMLGTCVWALHGVWDIVTGDVMVPGYFKRPPSDSKHDVVFLEDYWRPHWQAFATRIRASHPEAILFVAPPVFAPPPRIPQNDLNGRCCYSTHYYDGLTLINRRWRCFNGDALGVLRGRYRWAWLAGKFGEKGIRRSLQEQLGLLKDDAKVLGSYPTIIGEIGIPYDMDAKRSYGYTDSGKYKGDYSNQQKALDASLNAADGPNALNYTIWTYCPDNSHRWGDGWNLEDLSIWSHDDLRRIDAYQMDVVDTSLQAWKNAYDFLTDGARAVTAFCRPYPMATVGVPKDIQFDIRKSEFKLTVRVRPEDLPQPAALDLAYASSLNTFLARAADFTGDMRKSWERNSSDEKFEELATEIYIPVVHYASAQVLDQYRGGSPNLVNGDLSTLVVQVSVGQWTLEGQLLKWWYPVPTPEEGAREYTITIARAGGAIGAARARRTTFNYVVFWVLLPLVVVLVACYGYTLTRRNFWYDL